MIVGTEAPEMDLRTWEVGGKLDEFKMKRKVEVIQTTKKKKKKTKAITEKKSGIL